MESDSFFLGAVRHFVESAVTHQTTVRQREVGTLLNHCLLNLQEDKEWTHNTLVLSNTMQSVLLIR